MTEIVREATSGLGAMLADLLEQNLRRDPDRRALLRPSTAVLEAADAGVGVTLRIEPGRVTLVDGTADAGLAIRATSERLMALAAVPLRLGLPDPTTRAGRAVLADVLRGRIRISGLGRHPVRATRLLRLLSAGP